MRVNSNEKLLSDLLEKILFDEDDFDEFKTAIINISTGKNTPRLLKEKIISSRVRILEKLLDLFPFYMNQINKKQSIDKFVDNEHPSEIIEDLREKNELLTEIGNRIEVIHEKVQKEI